MTAGKAFSLLWEKVAAKRPDEGSLVASCMG